MRYREYGHLISLLAFLTWAVTWSTTVLADEDILRTKNALEAFRNQYMPARDHKAFAQSASGAWAWRASRMNSQFAEQDAINACNSHLGKDDETCVVVNIDGKWVNRPSALRITGFRQGLIEFDRNNAARIYQQGSSFLYETNGTCVAAGQETPCVWHGFEFDFESPEEVAELTCTTETNRPETVVTPDKVLGRATTASRWKFSLVGRKGNYLRPQFTTNVVGKPFHKATRCNYKGQEVLRFEFKFAPADSKAPQSTKT